MKLIKLIFTDTFYDFKGTKKLTVVSDVGVCGEKRGQIRGTSHFEIGLSFLDSRE